MKDHLLALEVKDSGATAIPAKGEGSDPGKGDTMAVRWSVSVLVLKPSVKGMVLVHALVLETVPFMNTGSGEHTLDDVSFDTFLDRLGEKVDLAACSRAVVAIPASLASYRHMDLPFGSRRKIRQVLPMELDAMLPLIEEDPVSDFVRTGLSTSGNHTLFTASLPRSIADALCLPLAKQGITPVLVSSAGYLAAHFLLDSLPKTGFFLLVAVRPHCLVITAVLNGVIVGIRSIVRGNDNDVLAADVSRSLMVFRQRLAIDDPISACHLMGSNTREDDLEALLKTALATAVGVADLSPVYRFFEKAGCDAEINPFEYIDAFAAAQCIGKQDCLNFCGNRHGQGAFVEKYMTQLVTVSLLALICFFLVVAGEYTKIRALKDQSAAMDRQARLIFQETFPEITTIVDPYMQMTVQVRQAAEQSGRSLNMETRFAGDGNIMELFFELSSRISDAIDVEISRLVFNEGRMVLSGSTDTYDSVDKMKSAIESSPLFTDVKISNAAADKNDKRIRFKFVFRTTDGIEDTPTVEEGKV